MCIKYYADCHEHRQMVLVCSKKGEEITYNISSEGPAFFVAHSKCELSIFRDDDPEFGIYYFETIAEFREWNWMNWHELYMDIS